MQHPLQYLDFDYSEDADGIGTLDAMASVAPAQLGALHGEIRAVLAWAHAQWPGGCGPLDEGGLWHYDLQGAQEVSTPLALQFDEVTGHLQATPGTPAPPRTQITLTLSGGPEFCNALREAFGVD
ncbi:hypothetical protein [Paracidovorax sp. MALMAid1276]|uniref:hypothetical protein n=1 Tax=Paracidovorax sp. MALMAid1276 TaxID=3411631 RepID=UPI003B9BAF20